MESEAKENTVLKLRLEISQDYMPEYVNLYEDESIDKRRKERK